MRSMRSSATAEKLLFAEHHFSHAASRLLSLALRGGRRAHHGRRRRMGDDLGRGRARQRAHDRQGNPLPAFARPALFGLHLLHRLQGQFRRVQGHGARALWRAGIRADDLRQSDRPESRRHVPAQSRLFQLLHRPDHDQRAVRRAVRRAAAQAGGVADPAPHGSWPPRSRR